MKTLYTARATTTKGREGHTKTDDGKLDLELSPPVQGGKGTNPEQLFAAGYSACFGSAIKAVADKQKIAVKEITVQAEVDLNQDENGYFISATLNATLDGVDEKTARDLVEKAHQVCPYSKATRGNIDVTLKVNNELLHEAA